MNKEKCVEYLKKNGYNAKIQEGIVMILYSIKIDDYEEYLNKIRNIMKNINYTESWGCKYSKDQIDNKSEMTYTEENEK